MRLLRGRTYCRAFIFVENETVTADQLLPVVFAGPAPARARGAAPASAEPVPVGGHASSLTPRDILKTVAEEAAPALDGASPSEGRVKTRSMLRF